MSEHDDYERYQEQVAQDRADEQAYLAAQEAEALARMELEQCEQEQTMNEAEIREDERQACWEDFIRVLRNGIKDAPHSMALKAMHEAVFLMGWKELGTGDGKPMHKRADSAVEEWLTTR